MQEMPSTRQKDAELWLAALGLSLLVNLALIALVSFSVLESSIWKKHVPETVIVNPPSAMTVVEIIAESSQKGAIEPPATPPTVLAKRFANTSPSQESAPPDKPTPFIGERNTQAASELAPDPSAAPLPAQAGIEPKDGEIETTKSRFRNGNIDLTQRLSADSSPNPLLAELAQPASEISPPSSETGNESSNSTNSGASESPEKLLEGPNPVDIPVQKQTAINEQKPDSPLPSKPEKKSASSPPRRPIDDPAFSSYRRKTAVVGSISRSGRSSALDVEDSPLGRYQAAISRAVELEWQRNCMRHRDYITPGYLTVRFFVEQSGKVRSVAFEGDMQTGEVQKGFTLNSIRDAKIPPMPPSLRKDFSKEPLELLFRFYF